jgi:spermidine synthase
MARTLAEVFPVVAPYQSFVPCIGTPGGFIVASKDADPRSLSVDLVDARVRERIDGELGFYDGQAHQHLVHLPRFLRQAVATCDRVVTDAAPLIV